MKRICEISGRPFEVSERDLAFYRKLSPVVGGQTLTLPPPRLCPDERQRRRLAQRNERYLYRRSCAIGGQNIVSAYSPDIDLKVCAKPAWLELDNREFGRDFDFTKPFFEQFSELFRQTYKCAVIQDGEMLNSDYCHFSGWLKNCYLLFDCGKDEDCMYGVLLGYCRDCFDGLFHYHCELCYDSVKLVNCYEVLFSTYSENCNSSAFLYDCIGCADCLGCANLRNKKHYAFNEYVGPEKFKELWEYYFCGSRERIAELQQRFSELLDRVPHRATRQINCEDVSGDDLTRCKDVYNSFNCLKCRDCGYCYDCFEGVTDCYDVGTFGEGMQYCYELSACGGALGKAEVSNCFFSAYLYYGGNNILYSINCHENSQNIFGCSDLRRGQYCILNKQYTAEEYQLLVPKIFAHMQETGEWGEFFPSSMSPFAYNQSLAQEFYPLECEEVLNRGLRWTDYQSPIPDISTVVDASNLPDRETEYNPELCKQTFRCIESGRLFKIMEKELAYYRKQSLPLPRLHPEIRQERRAARLNQRRLYERTCAESGEKILTSVPADSPRRVVSNESFLKLLS